MVYYISLLVLENHFQNYFTDFFSGKGTSFLDIFMTCLQILSHVKLSLVEGHGLSEKFCPC